jgi:MFS family permease
LIPRIRDAAAEYVKPRFFYGWTIVGVAGLGIFASGPGQSHTFSVFIEPISRDLGVSSATIATAYGLATLVAALVLPQAGRAVDRFGPRRALLVIIGFGLLRFFGQGSLMLGCANLVSHWFSRRRGFAMSLMALGFGVSMAVHPPLAQFLVVELGWRQAWAVLGVITWLIMLPPLLLLVHDKAEDLGLRPDGAAQPTTQSDASGPATTGLALAEALRTRSFYVLAVGWFAIAMLVTTLHFYQVKLLTSQGVDVAIAASAFTISALTMAVMMPLVGRLFDSVKTRYVFAIGLAVTAASLLAITFADSLVSTVFYALIFGLNNAFSMTMFGYMWPRYFGRRHLGAIQGTGQMVGVVGASLGPLPVGVAFDLIGDPTWTIRLLAIFPLAAAILAFSLLRTHPAIRADYEHLE